MLVTIVDYSVDDLMNRNFFFIQIDRAENVRTKINVHFFSLVWSLHQMGKNGDCRFAMLKHTHKCLILKKKTKTQI